MKLPNIFVNNKERFNKITSFFTNIAKELSLILWVIVVFLLIIYSYILNEYGLYEIKEFQTYEQISSSETFNIFS